MLVLSRQRDEIIMIGDDIEITVVDVRGDKVRLGITAPSKVAVHRKEVYLSILRENEQAARIGSEDSATLDITLLPQHAPRVRVGAPSTQKEGARLRSSRPGNTTPAAPQTNGVARLLGGPGPPASKAPRDGPTQIHKPQSYRKAI